MHAGILVLIKWKIITTICSGTVVGIVTHNGCLAGDEPEFRKEKDVCLPKKNTLKFI